jgi:F0F1-type ATP synthase membrane subunit a
MSNFMQDNEGNKSSTRLIMAAWALTVLVVWVIVSLYNKRLEEIPAGVQLVLGMVLTAKVVQKQVECKNENP